jgi:hypothetical protein
MTLYEHRGNARKAALASAVAATDLTITGDDLSGWPDGSMGLFWAAMNRDTPSEEKFLCSSRSDNTLIVFSDAGGNGRGRDDTTAQSHQIGATLEHVWTATEASAASAHANTGDGAHGYPPSAQIVLLTGAQTVEDKNLVGGTLTDATHVAVTGPQELADFRVRNTYVGSGAPVNTLGSDGDLYIEVAP